MGMRNEFNFRGANPVKIRSCKYLNNIVEQDHRRVKSRVSAMLGFKSFQNARIVLAGIELIQKLKKGQYGVPFSLEERARRLVKSKGATEPRKGTCGFLPSRPAARTVAAFKKVPAAYVTRINGRKSR